MSLRAAFRVAVLAKALPDQQSYNFKLLDSSTHVVEIDLKTLEREEQSTIRKYAALNSCALLFVVLLAGGLFSIIVGTSTTRSTVADPDHQAVASPVYLSTFYIADTGQTRAIGVVRRGYSKLEARRLLSVKSP